MNGILWLFGLLGIFVFVVLIVKSLAGSDGDYLTANGESLYSKPIKQTSKESEPEPKIGTYRIAPHPYLIGTWMVQEYQTVSFYPCPIREWSGTEYGSNGYNRKTSKEFRSFREAEAFVETLCEKKREAERLAEELRQWISQNPPRIYDCSIPTQNRTHG